MNSVCVLERGRYMRRAEQRGSCWGHKQNNGHAGFCAAVCVGLCVQVLPEFYQASHFNEEGQKY